MEQYKSKKVKVIRAWFCVSASKAHQVINVGFAKSDEIQKGKFGEGIYLATSPKYVFIFSKLPYELTNNIISLLIILTF